MVEIDCEKPMKFETSPKVTKTKRSLHWCRSISKKYLCRFYYSISQTVITLSGRRFITVSGVLLHYRAVIILSGSYYIIGRFLLHYRAFFITLSGSYYSIGRLLHYRLVQPSLYILYAADFNYLIRWVIVTYILLDISVVNSHATSAYECELLAVTWHYLPSVRLDNARSVIRP